MNNNLNDEILKILKMVESGIISAEKAYEMLDILGYGIKENNYNNDNFQDTPYINIDLENKKYNLNNNDKSNKKTNQSKKGRLHIKVIEKGKIKTSIDIPSRFFKFFNKFSSWGNININDADINSEDIKKEINDKIEKGIDIEVVVEDKNVKIFDSEGNVIFNIENK